MKYQVLSIKYFLFVLSFLILYTLYFIPDTGRVYADGVSLSVSPPLLQIEAIPPADARAPLTITNKSDQTVNLRIILNEFTDSGQNNGTLQYLGANDLFQGADKNILQKVALVDKGYSLDTLTLGPQQQKKLTLRILLPKKEPYSDYYFSLIFLAEPNPSEQSSSQSDQQEENNTSTARGGIAANVLLSVGPKNNPKGAIEEFSTAPYIESGPVHFSVRVRNNGSHFITPKGVILIKNMFGQTVGRIDLASSNILSGTVRSLFAIDSQATAVTQPEALWREKFLLGIYSASLSVALSDNGPIYTKSLHFIAFPITLLVGIVLAIVLTIIIYIRIKRRMASDQ